MARIAPPSQPGTSTQTTVTSAGPPAATTASRSAIGSRASATTTSSASPDARSRSASASVRHDADGARRAGGAGGGQAQRAGLAGAADDGDAPASAYALDDAGGQRRRAADVHHREAQLGGQVVGQDRGDGAAEQDGVPVAGHLLPQPVPAGQAVLDHQRREGQRDQRGDPVADGQAERRLRADLLDGADEHAAGAGLGVLHLAAGGDDLEHLGADPRRPSPRVLALELAVRRGVEVEPLDPDPDLVGPQLAAGVEPLGGLGQPHGVVQHPVQAGRIAVHGPHHVVRRN